LETLEDAVGTTVAVPRVPMPLAENVTIPVGPFPMLPGVAVIIAVSCTGVIVVVVVGFAETVVVVGAAATVNENGLDVLGP